MFTYIQLNLQHDVDRSRILERRNLSFTYTQRRAVSSGKVSECFLMASSAAVRGRSSNAYSLCSPQRRMSKMNALINDQLNIM